MNKILHFEYLYNGYVWLNNIQITINDLGKIVYINCDINLHEKNNIEYIEGYAIPGIHNGHSHAFQYIFSGYTEFTTNKKLIPDNFWSWRNYMYNIASQVTPDDLEIIASKLYMEMLKYGYTHVSEFQYLHHNSNGKNYINKNEMSRRLINAAQHVGIGITIIPIFYQQANFNTPALPEQKRFICKNVNEYWNLYESISKICNEYQKVICGIGIHSLRTVQDDMIKELLNHILMNNIKVPIHMHISEQTKEVNDCIYYLKNTPIEWMTKNFSLNKNFNFIHATHASDQELFKLTQSNCNIILCPSTEANLGDGIFPFLKYMSYNGNWAIGSDSQINLSWIEELRWLDYIQRLHLKSRNIFSKYTNINGEFGKFLFDKARLGGIQASYNKDNFLSLGSFLDCIIIKKDFPKIHLDTLDKLFSCMIYSGDIQMIKGIIINGKWQIKNNTHIHEDIINTNYKKLLNKIHISI
jgi:formimidoylglutamate deiminase